MNKVIINYCVALLCIAGFFSCSDDDDAVKQTVFHLTLKTPDQLESPVVSGFQVTFKDVNSGRTTVSSDVVNNRLSIILNEGLYEISGEGNISYLLDGATVEQKVRVRTTSDIQIVGAEKEAELTMFLYSESAGFVFREIFFTGTTYPNGDQYSGDKYFIIYNNSSETLYADRYAIVESAFLTVTKQDYRPDIMHEAMAVGAVYAIPGDGTSYPVEPGKSLLICDNALDHTQINPNSFDLSNADFEWYDVSSNPSVIDQNNPDVTDMNKIYSKSKTLWSPHNRGFTAYALAKIPVDNETYLKDNKYDYEYDLVVGENVYPMTGSAYKIPNSWIVDAVNLSVQSEYEWQVTDASLDIGYTYCGKIDHDKTRYNKSVVRKVLSTTPDGREILQDTNNSAKDFIPEASPSLFAE